MQHLFGDYNKTEQSLRWQLEGKVDMGVWYTEWVQTSWGSHDCICYMYVNVLYYGIGENVSGKYPIYCTFPYFQIEPYGPWQGGILVTCGHVTLIQFFSFLFFYWPSSCGKLVPSIRFSFTYHKKTKPNICVHLINVNKHLCTARKRYLHISLHTPSLSDCIQLHSCTLAVLGFLYNLTLHFILHSLFCCCYCNCLKVTV